MLVFTCALCISLVSLTAAGAEPKVAQQGSTYGVHGMVLFGNSESMYVSHLPMFHAPHDYQVVLQVHCQDAKLDKEIKARLEQKITLWTIEPEQFEITRLAQDSDTPLKEFKANFVLGHFEQGGKTEYNNVPVTVEKTLIFRQLSAEARNTDSARYVQIGSGRHRFLLKEIDSRPDFDHVLAITTPAHARKNNILLKKSGLQAASDAQFLQTIQTDIARQATVSGTVYLDHADLE